MATTSLTWSFSNELPLIGCGIDSEKTDRFSSFPPPPLHHMPFVFTELEIQSAFRSESPQMALCASFCCKEALRKALGEPYNWNDCQFLWQPRAMLHKLHKLTLDTQLMRHHDIIDTSATIEINPLHSDELVAVVYLFGKKI